MVIFSGDVIIKETNVGQFSVFILPFSTLIVFTFIPHFLLQVEVIEAILNLAVPALIAGIDHVKFFPVHSS